MFDDVWKQRVLGGDARAAAEMVDRLAGSLYAFCLPRVGRNVHHCEDVVQETFLQALKQLPNYEPSRCGNQLQPWLIGLARNEIRRVLKHKQRSRPMSQFNGNAGTANSRDWQRFCEELCAGSSPEDALEQAETEECVQAALQRLPDHYQQTLRAKYLDGHSVRRMADERSTTEKAVESMLTRARDAFRDAFAAVNQPLPPPDETSPKPA